MKNGKYKIAIDVSPLSDGNSTRGVGFYTQRLVAALQHEVKVNPDYQHFQIDLIENRQFKIENYDLVHYPYFTPFQLTLPGKIIPTIITIHDVIERQFKDHFPVGIKGELKWQIQRFRARQADYLITVSHYSKYQIADYFHYPTDHIFVTYPAADPVFKPLAHPQNKYHLPPKFVLYVGDIGWNKNVPRLVNACLQLKYPLVIVGSSAVKPAPVHPWTEDIRWLQSQKSPLIHCLGFVSNDDLVHIYNLATIYCQPSYAEGFGLPVVEAMSCGTPVVYSQETSLPEIMDFSGEFFDPYRPTDLSRALKSVWTGSIRRQKYRRLGLDRSHTFSWQQTALGTLAVYQLALLHDQK